MTANISTLSCASGFVFPGTFVACGLLGIQALAAHLDNVPDAELNITHLFISDATSDADLLMWRRTRIPGEERFWNYDFDVEATSDLAELREKELEYEHALHAYNLEAQKISYAYGLADVERKYDLRQQRALLVQLILPRLSPSLETLVYLPYRGILDNDSIFCWHAPGDSRRDKRCPQNTSDPRHFILHGIASFPHLERLTLRLDVSYGVPFDSWSPGRFPALTHLHFADNERLAAMTMLPEMHNLPPSLTHLRLSGFTYLPEDTRFGMFHPYSEIDMEDQHIMTSMPVDAEPLCQRLSLARNVTYVLQHSYGGHVVRRLPSDGCALDDIDYPYDECVRDAERRISRMEAIPRQLKACGDNVHVVVLSGMDSELQDKIQVFPLSVALEEGGWLKNLSLDVAVSREWKWEGREIV